MIEAVDFKKVRVVQQFPQKGLTVSGCIALSTHAGWPVFMDTSYLCMQPNSDNYEIWECRDHFEQGQWFKQELLSSYPISNAVAERLLGDVCEADRETIRSFDIYKELEKRLERIREKNQADGNFVDLLSDINEVLCCMKVNAYRASLCLCGRILEWSIKWLLTIHRIPFEKNWMLGSLLGAAENTDTYLDPSLKNCSNIINQQRIAGVHAKERVPIPSKNQALMVLHATLDVVDRCVLV